MDTGFKDKTVLLYGYYDFKKATLFIESENVLKGHEVTSKAIAESVKSNEKNLQYKDTDRIADNNDPIFLNDLNISQGINFQPTSKDSLEAMINEVRTWVGNGRVQVNEGCTELIGCLKNGIWNKRRSAFDRSKVYGHYDALASLVYLIRNINIHDNPIPLMHG